MVKNIKVEGMGKVSSMYFRDSIEREKVRLFLSLLRSGLSSGDLGEVIEIYEKVEKVSNEMPAEQPDLPRNEDREIPHTLQRFVDEGWDLDTAFRIYDEWKAEINNVGGDVYVKSLNQRFMEERMKRDADESAE